MKKIDARGLSCPKPVVKTKNALEDNDEVEVLVDNEVAAQNVKKLGIKLGGKVTLIKEKEDLYKLVINDIKKSSQKDKKDDDKKVVFIKSNLLGKGDKELGDILIRGFINTLNQIDPLPKKIIFMNSGVKLSCNNEEVIKHLKQLEKNGVEILSCGTCLDFYGLKDELKVGQISNMYEIVDSLNNGNIIYV